MRRPRWAVVTVAVEDSSSDGAAIRATVRMSASDETTVPLSSFTLLVGGRLRQVLFSQGERGLPVSGHRRR